MKAKSKPKAPETNAQRDARGVVEFKWLDHSLKFATTYTDGRGTVGVTQCVLVPLSLWHKARRTAVRATRHGV